MPKKGVFRPKAQSPALLALQAKLNQGLALHKKGKLADAERIYGEVLRQQPNNFDALHLLGVIAVLTQRTERGVELIGKAIGTEETTGPDRTEETGAAVPWRQWPQRQ